MTDIFIELQDAEAEIRDLKGAVQYQTRQAANYRRDYCSACDQLTDARLQVTLLKAALEKIANWKLPANPEYFDMRYEHGRNAAAEIAREALGDD